MIEQTEQTERTDTANEQADVVLKKAIGTAAQEPTRTAAGAPAPGAPAAGAPGADERADARPERAAGMESLVRARQAMGLGASDIAAKLGMATRQIDALERGDWQALPGQAFVRGALRSYGKSVGVDVDPLLASIGGQVLAPELRSSSSLDAAMPHRGTLGFSSSGSGGRLVWIVLGVAAVIAMALYFGDAFEIGRPGNGEQPLASGDTAARSQQSSTTASGSTGSGVAASRSTATTPRTSLSGAAGVAAAGTSSASAGSGNTAPAGAAAGGGPTSGSGFAQLAPLAPLAPLSPAPAATGGASTSAAAGAGVATSNNSNTPSGSPAAAADAKPDAALATGTGAQPADAAATGAGATAGTTLAATTASTAAGSASGNAAAPGAGRAAASAADTLRLQFARESWVDIRDGGGKVLLQGTQPAGSSKELNGAAPFKLVIGNAEHVRLDRNGQRVDFGNRTRSGVARLTLD